MEINVILQFCTKQKNTEPLPSISQRGPCNEEIMFATSCPSHQLSRISVDIPKQILETKRGTGMCLKILKHMQDFIKAAQITRLVSESSRHNAKFENICSKLDFISKPLPVFCIMLLFRCWASDKKTKIALWLSLFQIKIQVPYRKIITVF